MSDLNDGRTPTSDGPVRGPGAPPRQETGAAGATASDVPAAEAPAAEAPAAEAPAPAAAAARPADERPADETSARVREYMRDALGPETGHALLLASVKEHLVPIRFMLGRALLEALDRESFSLEAYEKLTPHLRTFLKMTSQLRELAQLEQRLAADRHFTKAVRQDPIATMNVFHPKNSRFDTHPR